MFLRLYAGLMAKDRSGYGSLLLAILLWAALASMLLPLARVPPLLLTGVALVIGAVPSFGKWRNWVAPLRVWCWAVIGVLTYHLLLILALRWAVPVKANLINYLWPLLIVLLAPLFAPTAGLNVRQMFAAGLGFTGAALAITSRASSTNASDPLLGYSAAFLAAIIWACYTLYLRNRPHLPDTIVSGFCALAGVIALILHALLETTPVLSRSEWSGLLALGIGPMGLAFLAWNRAAKRIEPRRLGVYAFATPVLSTLGLLIVAAEPLTLTLIAATACIVLAGVLASPATK